MTNKATKHFADITEELLELDRIYDYLKEIKKQSPSSEIYAELHECAERVINSRWQLCVSVTRLVDEFERDD